MDKPCGAWGCEKGLTRNVSCPSLSFSHTAFYSAPLPVPTRGAPHCLVEAGREECTIQNFGGTARVFRDLLPSPHGCHRTRRQRSTAPWQRAQLVAAASVGEAPRPAPVPAAIAAHAPHGLVPSFRVPNLGAGVAGDVATGPQCDGGGGAGPAVDACASMHSVARCVAPCWRHPRVAGDLRRPEKHRSGACGAPAGQGGGWQPVCGEEGGFAPELAARANCAPPCPYNERQLEERQQ